MVRPRYRSKLASSVFGHRSSDFFRSSDFVLRNARLGGASVLASRTGSAVVSTASNLVVATSPAPGRNTFHPCPILHAINPKSESPNPERSPSSEIRNRSRRRRKWFGHAADQGSSFGLLSDFGLRPSDFTPPTLHRPPRQLETFNLQLETPLPVGRASPRAAPGSAVVSTASCLAVAAPPAGRQRSREERVLFLHSIPSPNSQEPKSIRNPNPRIPKEARIPKSETVHGDDGNGSARLTAKVVTRSFPPFPPRTATDNLLKSRSFTRSRNTSSNRNPLP